MLFSSLLLATAIGLGGTNDLPVQIPDPANLEPGRSEILVNWPEGSWTHNVPHQTWEHVQSVTRTRFGWLVCVEAKIDGLCFNVDL